MVQKRIWHTGTEIPNSRDRYIIKWKGHNSYKLATGKKYVVNRLNMPTWGYMIERWAYIKDLEDSCRTSLQGLIDWEQRRYEIAKDMLPAIYMDDGNAQRADHSPSNGFEYKTPEGCAKEAVHLADALINELKK